MYDPRIDELARKIVQYSCSVKRNHKVLIDAIDVPESIVIALVRAVREVKAQPFVNIQNMRIKRELDFGMTESQVDIMAEVAMAQMQHMNAYVAIRGSHNITEGTDVPPEKRSLVLEKMRPIQNQRVNNTNWCVLRWPTPAMAQQAMMSTEAFENVFFDVCLYDYEALIPGMNALKKRMDDAKEVHITGPGTDLRFSLDGQIARVCAGTHNLPDGEVFSSPLRESVQGMITYNAPTVYQGIAFDNVCLEFENGKIVNATANNTKELNKILDMDEGARYIGEFAIAFNNALDAPMRDILFDEKIGGSFHFTPGQAYEGPWDNGNRSQVHWDMVVIQRPDWGGGEMAFDGEVIRRDGLFLPKDLAPLNPNGQATKKKAARKAKPAAPKTKAKVKSKDKAKTKPKAKVKGKAKTKKRAAKRG